MLSTRKPVGDSIGRVEGKDKVTGRAKYTADHAIPNLAYAILVQSEIPHGRVLSDSLEKRSAEAAAAPGVLHVLTPLNCPALQVLPRDLTFSIFPSSVDLR
jgi:xanthine dehydrogenase YagR molybdenum-binding subunit